MRNVLRTLNVTVLIRDGRSHFPVSFSFLQFGFRFSRFLIFRFSSFPDPNVHKHFALQHQLLLYRTCICLQGLTAPNTEVEWMGPNHLPTKGGPDTDCLPT